MIEQYDLQLPRGGPRPRRQRRGEIRYLHRCRRRCARCGCPVTKAYLYRLLGDVSGNQVVQATGVGNDYAMVGTMLGLVSPNPLDLYLNNDVDGDGKITQTDRNLISLNKNKFLVAGRKLGLSQ